jgi:hypothetical protein
MEFIQLLQDSRALIENRKQRQKPGVPGFVKCLFYAAFILAYIKCLGFPCFQSPDQAVGGALSSK